MDPFTVALATFGVQKLRGKSTRTALKDAALVGGTTFGLGRAGIGAFEGPPLSSLGVGQQVATTPKPPSQKNFLQKLLLSSSFYS